MAIGTGRVALVTGASAGIGEAAASALVGEDVGDEILLGREVVVEGAVGQAGVGHHGGHAGAVDAVLFEAPPGCVEDALSRGLLLVLAVAHSEPLSPVWRPTCPPWPPGSGLGST